jgi:hypothetical protein
MDKVVVFPGPFISIFEVKNHLKIKSRIISYINDDLKNINCCKNNNYEQLKTSFDPLDKNNLKFKDKIMDDGEIIKSIVWDSVDYFFNKTPFFIQIKPEKSVLEDIWFNCYEKDSFFATHCHPGSTFSGIYLLHLEGKNNTHFYSSGATNSTYQTIGYSTENIPEGHVILFSSEMFHEVPKLNSKKITLSFNITTR